LVARFCKSYAEKMGINRILVYLVIPILMNMAPPDHAQITNITKVLESLNSKDWYCNKTLLLKNGEKAKTHRLLTKKFLKNFEDL
jgi:hypothetical protein